ncbi:unnamed protein product [Cyprideis torosa]|uniref:Cation/H+ exchanger transmembrane domain-containing protein n=1 Tax=Cyprideis torosa TaxID=163714 RepID=A0A7R8ZK64_9CRUS|nr:unnamed protein product [Cyprideis torosa]CAG0881088.1 unnamed protein product [Cyprideis torosa]
MDVEPLLTMLVFGESILNDAVAIVLTRTVLESTGPGMENAGFFFEAWTGIQKFFLMFFGSAGIGVASALVSALLLKYVDLRSNPSLEFGMMLVFCYAPYGLAEGMHLSGIMAILFCGVVMSHYTHYNLSPVTQITMQQSLRTVAFMAETCVFAYLGLAIFSFRHILRLDLILWGIILILLGRAANIYPLSWVSNYFREVQISKTNMFIMWFSGLRGAIAYALALHLEFNDEKRHVLVTTTLTIVLFTILVLGGSTMPIMKFLLWRESQQLRPKRKRRKREHVTETISLSKTREIGKTLDSEHYSEMTEEEALSDVEGSGRRRTQLRGFLKWDAMYFRPLFTRKFTPQELKDCKTQMTNLTDQWYAAVKTTSPLLPSDDEEVEILNVQSL